MMSYTIFGNDFPAEGQLLVKWCESLRWETQDEGL
jgi:hypothetical protein